MLERLSDSRLSPSSILSLAPQFLISASLPPQPPRCRKLRSCALGFFFGSLFGHQSRWNDGKDQARGCSYKYACETPSCWADPISEVSVLRNQRVWQQDDAGIVLLEDGSFPSIYVKASQ